MKLIFLCRWTLLLVSVYTTGVVAAQNAGDRSSTKSDYNSVVTEAKLEKGRAQNIRLGITRVDEILKTLSGEEAIEALKECLRNFSPGSLGGETVTKYAWKALREHPDAIIVTQRRLEELSTEIDTAVERHKLLGFLTGLRTTESIDLLALYTFDDRRPESLEYFIERLSNVPHGASPTVGENSMMAADRLDYLKLPDAPPYVRGVQIDKQWQKWAMKRLSRKNYKSPLPVSFGPEEFRNTGAVKATPPPKEEPAPAPVKSKPEKSGNELWIILVFVALTGVLFTVFVRKYRT